MKRRAKPRVGLLIGCQYTVIRAAIRNLSLAQESRMDDAVDRREDGFNVIRFGFLSIAWPVF
jgi:hypothetical protein